MARLKRDIHEWLFAENKRVHALPTQGMTVFKGSGVDVDNRAAADLAGKNLRRQLENAG